MGRWRGWLRLKLEAALTVASASSIPAQKTTEVQVASVAANLGGEGHRIEVRLQIYK